MSSVIATWGMIRSKVPSFPAPAAGRENECLTKSEILSQSGQDAYVGGSYGDTECTRIDDVRQISGTYKGSYLLTYDDGTKPQTLVSDATITINNGVATIIIPNIEDNGLRLGRIIMKADIENGIVNDVTSWETPDVDAYISFLLLNSGSVDGLIFEIEIVYSWLFSIYILKYKGTKQ